MSIPATCSHCGASYNLNDQMLGKKVRCKSCQQAFVVGDGPSGRAAGRSQAVSAQTPPPSRPSRKAAVVDDDDLADAELPRRRKENDRPVKKSSTGKVVLIVGGIGTALVLACCVVPTALCWYFGVFRSDTEIKTPDGAVIQVNGNLTPEQRRQLQKQGLGPGNVPVGFAIVNPPSGVDEALQFLTQDDAHKQAGADWLARQPVDAGKQTQVARALEPLLSQNATQGAAARALATWGDKDSVPALARALDACDLKQGIPPESMKTIMATVAGLKDPRGADAVARCLTNFFLQRDAEKALATLGPGAEPAVLKYYFHRDGGARDAARRLAQGYGTKQDAILAQAVVSLKDSEKDTRFQAAEWLAQVQVSQAMQAQVAKALVEAATADTDPGMCPRCVRALAVWATPEEVPGIAALLDGNSSGAQAARGDLIDLLGRLKDERGVPALVRQLNNFGDRGRASRALRAVGAPAEKELLKLVNDTSADQGAREEAVRILKGIGSKENVEVAAAVTKLGQADVGSRRDGARVLAEMAAPDKAKQADVAAALMRAVNDNDPGVREQAAKALVVWATPEQVPDLLRLVDNMQAQVRQNVMMALGKLHEERAAAPIAARLLVGEDRRAAGDALRALGSKAETEVAKYLAANDKGVVLDVIKILGDIGTKTSVPTLKKVVLLTQAKQKDIALAAAQAIQQINSR